MRFAVWLVAASAVAQPLSRPCEPSRQTIELLESAPPRGDFATPYEDRIGALRALAAKHPDNFFIQRAYQDSFRRAYFLGEEYDRALAMYRARLRDPLSRYYEARLLMAAFPAPAKKTFDDLLREHPEFVWPRQDVQEWARFPGRDADPELAAAAHAFAAVCPDAFGMPTRAGLERRNTPLELASWRKLWDLEKAPGLVRADLKRIASWPFRADPELYDVYEDAARILNDPSVLDTLRAKVEREAPDSFLALRFAISDLAKKNPHPGNSASPSEWKKYEENDTAMSRKCAEQWPKLALPQLQAIRDLGRQAVKGAVTVSERELTMIDRLLAGKAVSPDAFHQLWPTETFVAGIYVAGKVRLDRVPALLDAGMRSIEVMTKYQPALELQPGRSDSRKSTADQTERIRAAYLLAVR